MDERCEAPARRICDGEGVERIARRRGIEILSGLFEKKSIMTSL